MLILQPSKDDAIYDASTDVMYFGIDKARYTDEYEVAPGIHVLYAYDTQRTNNIVGVEIEYFSERYREKRSISVSGLTPFELVFPTMALA